MLIRIGIYPHIAAGSSRHITAFSVGRPVPGPRLRPSSGRAGRHQCGCGKEGGCSQAGDHRFGQHGSSAEPSIVLEKWAELRSCQPDATPASSSATPTGRRLPVCISRRSWGGARRRRRCRRRVASARAGHGKLTAAVRRPALVINRNLGPILIDTPVADKPLWHPVGAPFSSGRR
jgi:hypothetical protein